MFSWMSKIRFKVFGWTFLTQRPTGSFGFQRCTRLCILLYTCVIMCIRIKSHMHIHVASRRQPPAPHRWAAARNCQ